jgi:tetratricopeptide (TPR) repeat protein
MLRHFGPLCCLLCLGCQTWMPGGAARENEPAQKMWERGQAAMYAGRPHEAIQHYQESLKHDTALVQNHLSLAAAFLESGDTKSACKHLGLYLEQNPERLNLRAHYAELLWRIGKKSQAALEFKHFLILAEENDDDTLAQMIQAHSRLMELADEKDHEYAKRLHRGVGLYLLALRRSRLSDPEGQLPVEALLRKSLIELNLAHKIGPREARPCWYQYLVARQLGQHQQAQRWLKAAQDAADFTPLTATELCRLHMAANLCERRW